MSQTDTTVDKYEYGSVELTLEDVQKIDSGFHQVYYEEGGLATPDKLYDRFQGKYSMETIVERYQDPEFRDKVEKWGIVEQDGSNLLEPVQLMVANMELNFFDKRSIRTFLEPLGITTNQYAAWRRNPAYINYIRSRMEKMWDNVESESKKTLMNAIMSGDVKAATIALEMMGKYSKNVNMNVNVQQVLNRVVEIVIAHVEDPEVVEAIATDLEALSRG